MKLLFFILISSLQAEEIQVHSGNIRELLENRNAKVRAARLSLEAAGQREGSLARSFFPALDIYGAQESFKTGTGSQKTQPTYGAEARINLLNSGHDYGENQIRKLEKEKRGFEARKVTTEEMERTMGIYWQVLYLGEKITLLKAALDVNAQNLNSARRRIRSGVATDSDRFEFEMKDVDLRRELSTAEVEVNTQKRRLMLQLGLEDSASLKMSEALSHDHNFEAVLKHSEDQHEFLYKGAELQAKQHQISASTLRREWLPKLDAFAAYNTYNERLDSAGPGVLEEERKETVVGLRMRMSLPSGLESMRQAAALNAESQAAQTLADQQKKEVELILQAEMAALKNLHDQVHEAEENISRAERYYKMTQSEYGRGVKNSPDVLGASEKLFDMRDKRLEIIRDFQISKAHILAKIWN